MAEKDTLSRRERQIMDVLYRLGSATAAEVQENIADAPSYSAIRALLRILVEKGHARHSYDGPRYVYSPVISRPVAQKSALRQLVKTFFNGSASNAVAALIDMSGKDLTDSELDRLAAIVEQAKREGK
ncbi:MAG TPA: BlaI/MecI/CopY family transcriptional regulator [Gemmatimonadaceae bacterium]|nr:BlaI/MecI/CopY family transcriptional regulator [Gemmatimonadaceae bacterium]